MRLRLELFVSDLGTSVAFYTEVLGFQVTRADPGYVSVRHGSVVLGLGPVAKLPETGGGPGFTRQRLHADRAPAWRSSWRSMTWTKLGRCTAPARPGVSSPRRCGSNRGVCRTFAWSIRTAITYA